MRTDRRLSTISDMLDQAFGITSETTQTYPPYDLIKVSDEQYKIRVATNGASKENLSVDLVGGQLVVRHTADKDRDIEVHYVYKGISTRSFELKFHIRQDREAEVNEAKLVDGILEVTVVLTKKGKTISII